MMESRLRRLEHRSDSAVFAAVAQLVADELDLEPAELVAEAEAVLIRIGGRSLSCEAIAAMEGVDATELARDTARLLATWEAMR